MGEREAYQTVVQLTAAVGPATGLLARRWMQSVLRDACADCRDLLHYARRFTPARVERAALRLMDYAIQDIASLRFLLDHEIDILVDRNEADLDGQLLLPFVDGQESRRT